ncbi:4Fe-4S double cluster binding domain-containing protein [Paramaledivibacter caminithermalis]|uniref:4Fe-4S double cluster binding domain-containing protein n=1 Tax=Paramaledivibacter caminithermalis (strain DSM 15212 / CIP 107654 / DViRD3) TaxID=1121301 RepID=A0A1M6LCR2_PARC5|nr:4Fe-4S double cluster binding domain-containing protein [Paramaledivibacter caminithermalis]SHJ68977.1 4Fe-4S double cluster binding domain-containing protein [Paramaledivibacter caminithermalis DSM 15212]
MDYREKLKNLLISLGAAKVGFGYLEDVLPNKYKHLKTGISVIFRLSDQIINEIEEEPTHSYFHHYRTVNYKIDQIILSGVSKLQQWGYLAMPIAASQSVNIDGNKYKGIFPHRTAATRAGLGWIGKNACLITKEFGPRIRLGTILTNMEVAYDEPITNSFCGDCNKCVKACPALALRGNMWYAGIKREELIDAQACSEHMSNHYKHIGRGSVCGICIKNCPVGTNVIRIG